VTTSKLLSNTPEINEHDLQVVKDYALEAPWEWRMVLEAMVSIAEKHLYDDDLLGRIDELEAALRVAAMKIENVVIAVNNAKDLPKEVAAADAKIKEIVEEMREVVTS
jgi:hypothetical protein